MHGYSVWVSKNIGEAKGSLNKCIFSFQMLLMRGVHGSQQSL